MVTNNKRPKVSAPDPEVCPVPQEGRRPLGRSKGERESWTRGSYDRGRLRVATGHWYLSFLNVRQDGEGG